MIQTSYIAWSVFAALVVFSSIAGILLSSGLPWSDSARRGGVMLTSGFALGPFLSGMLSVVALAALPGASHGTHVAFVFLGLAAIAAISFLIQRRPGRILPESGEQDWRVWPFLILLILWAVVLLVNSIMLPLTQNDALEYATVGRILFDVRDLAAYPAVHPELTPSGFYGPWTHPPLYVAMIYLTYALQGDADIPGLMRMIAPWCALAATGLVHSMGAQVNRLTGSVAALIFISTPLFYLGADSALIDALPILGFTLVMAAIVSMDNSRATCGAIAGVALGFALWTHSQAILFLPLSIAAVLLFRGWTDWRIRVRECVVMLIVALVMAGWPYMRNVVLFGSPISDNPAVFSMPELAWPEYFSVMRGIDNWPAIIQYGVLKGWFALEAYGFIFWFMACGGVTYILWIGSRAKQIIRTGSVDAADHRVMWVALGLIGVYLAGVIFSVVLGLDLMIKNERYMLVILPAVAIAAAFWFGGPTGRHYSQAEVSSSKRKLNWSALQPWALVLLLLMLGGQLLVLAKFRLAANNLNVSTLGSNFETTLQNRPEYRAVRYLRFSSPADAVVLSLKPSDMYYAGRRMVSYLDPRLIPFYRERKPEDGLKRLHELGITHVQVPNYSLPPLYNSVLQSILRDPTMSTLQFSADGNQIYTLRPASLRNGPQTDITPGTLPWSKSTNLILGGRKALGALTASKHVMAENEVSRGGLPIPIFHRDWSTSLISTDLPVKGGNEYGIDLRLEGSGLIRFWLHETEASPVPDIDSHSQNRILIGDLVLSEDQRERMVMKRVRLSPATRFISLEIEHVGTSIVHVIHASLVPIVQQILPDKVATEK